MSENRISRVRCLTKQLLDKPHYISLNEHRAQVVASALSGVPLEIPKWDFVRFYPQSDDFEEMCKFYLIFNSINYCYFNYGTDKFEDHGISGSSLASLKLTQSWEDLQDPVFLSQVDENYLLSELFAAESPISLVKERVRSLREVGKFLNENVHIPDLFRRLFLRYKEDAYLVSQALPTLLPTWADPFYKRSQLFVAMVYGRFQDKEDLPILKESLDDLTVFADYRVPQTLTGMGIINPKPSILNRLYNYDELESGSRKELELRAATIAGADLLTERLNEVCDEHVNSLHTDFLLWSAMKRKESLPREVFVNFIPNHHRTFTTDY